MGVLPMVDPGQDELLVAARGISRIYSRAGRPIAALQPMSCEIRPRQRIAIMGSSGSGKLTLLHLLAGLDTPTTGKIAWPSLGRPEDLRPSKILVAFQG